jgi:hypothetical protein
LDSNFSPSLNETMSSHPHGSSTANIVGIHYRVGKKIGEGSFGVIFEGKFLLFNATPHSIATQWTKNYLTNHLRGFVCSRNKFVKLPNRRYQVC